jgi:hypothetical protein
MLNVKKALAIVFAAGSLLFFFSTPAAQAQRPAHSDQDVLTCLNTRVNQIRKMDNGANQLSVYVTSGTAYFTGIVVNASYKNQLMTSALDCGARAFNVSNLKVDPGHKSDADIQTCLNPTVDSVLHNFASPGSTLSVSVRNGDATFTGNIVTANDVGKYAVVSSFETKGKRCGAHNTFVNVKWVKPH